MPLQKLFTHPLTAKAWTWTKLLTLTGTAQMAVQGLSFLSGILVIRLLSQEEYAFYTLANTMLGMLTVLADGGISTGVMAEGGKVWQDKKKLGAVLATGIALRKRFATGTLIIATPLLYYFLNKHGASPLMSTLLILSLLPTFLTALTGKILEIAPKLHQQIGALQGIQVTSSIGRLGLTALTLFIFPFASVAILCAGLPQIYANWKMRRISRELAEPGIEEDPQARREILKIVRRILPGAIYYSFSGQITVWIISVFGQTQSIAEIGALGRLSQILTIFSSIVSIVLFPRFARAQFQKIVLLRKFLVIIALSIGFCLAMLAATLYAPDLFLMLLGVNYEELSNELYLSTLASSLSILGGVIFGANASRGWVLSPVVLIPLVIINQILAIILSDLKTTEGVLKMSALSTLFPIFMGISYCFFHLFYNPGEN